MQYNLNVNLSTAALNTIYGANQFVTLTKSVVANPLVSGNLPVAWLAIAPFASNVISWQENYSIYATGTMLQAGATIVQSSVTPSFVSPGFTYTLQNGSFTSAANSAPNVFTAANQQQNGLAFGLAQSASVNGTVTTSPLNSVGVAFNETATFTPEEVISIYLSSYNNNGVVISQVASNALSLTLTSQNPSATVAFDTTSNTFYLVSQSARSMADTARSLPLAA